ncbi:MAG: iron donor protein CyaY [Acidiferrobacteraceae bacterium]
MNLLADPCCQGFAVRERKPDHTWHRADKGAFQDDWMTDSEFQEQATRTLTEIEQAVEASGADVDFETVSEVLTLEFQDGSKIIVNKQSPAHQIWVATRSGGFHYGYDGARKAWFNDQTGRELLEELEEFTSRQAGAPVALR